MFWRKNSSENGVLTPKSSIFNGRFPYKKIIHFGVFPDFLGHTPKMEAKQTPKNMEGLEVASNDFPFH